MQYICCHFLSISCGVDSKLIKDASTGTQLILSQYLYVILTLSLWTRFYSEIVLPGRLQSSVFIGVLKVPSVIFISVINSFYWSSIVVDSSSIIWVTVKLDLTFDFIFRIKYIWPLLEVSATPNVLVIPSSSDIT